MRVQTEESRRTLVITATILVLSVAVLVNNIWFLLTQ